MIELRQVTKDYAIGLRGMKHRALDKLTLTIPEGAIYGLLGPNGSGKSTTIKIILGLIEPSGGECWIDGISSRRVEARANIGYMPETPQFYRHMTGSELITFYARMSGVSGPSLRTGVKEVIEWVGMSAAANRRVGDYSKGMLQRIGLAQAVVHDPALIILDEPTAGVDPLGCAAMMELILQLKSRGKTLLLTSHLLSQMESICDRVALLDRGRLLLEGVLEELLPARSRSAVWLDTLHPEDRLELETWLAVRGRKPESVAQSGLRLDRLFVELIRTRQPAATGN